MVLRYIAILLYFVLKVIFLRSANFLDAYKNIY